MLPRGNLNAGYNGPSLSSSGRSFCRHFCVALIAVFFSLAAALKLLLFFDKLSRARVGARAQITRS
jgi:hypothetical protein